MLLLSRFCRGSLYALALVTTWLVVEAAVLAVTEPDVPWWSVPFNPGVAAPLALLAAAIGGVLFWLWAGVSGHDDPVAACTGAVWAWLWRGDAAVRVRRSGWLVAALVALAAWLAAGVGFGRLAFESIKTTSYAVALVLLLQLGIAAALAVASVAVAEPARWLLGRIEGHRPQLVRPGWLAVAAVLALLGAVALLWWVAPDVMPHLPWALAAGPVAGIGVLLAASRWLPRLRSARRVTLGVCVLYAALGTATAAMPDAAADARAVFVDQAALGATWYGVVDERLDFDDDGSLHLYGGGDCAPFDPDIGPHRREIIGSGVDENCSGSDLTEDVDALSTGNKSYPRPEAIDARPHVILITTDALSHGHTSVGGYGRDTTPHLAEWAERATVFEHAFSLSSSTRLSLPGLVTGMFNSMVPMNKRRVHPYPYASEVVTMASLLDEQGYKTIHIPGDDYFGERRWGGYTAGFDIVDHSAWKEASDPVHTSPDVTDLALSYLKEHEDGEGPLFLWVHYYDHHAPYRTPSGHEVFSGKDEQTRYDNELRFADGQWARLLEYVEGRFPRDGYMVVFTSDHGEAFDENHPKEHHDFSLHTAVLHVPLIIQTPSGRGRRVDGLVSHADVLPTVANVLGVSPVDGWVGESLVPVLFDGGQPEKDVVYSLFYIPEAVKRDEDGFRMVGLRTEELYYFEDRRKEERWLVDWKSDPIDAHDLSAELDGDFELYRYLTARWMERLRDRERALTQHYR